MDHSPKCSEKQQHPANRSEHHVQDAPTTIGVLAEIQINFKHVLHPEGLAFALAGEFVTNTVTRAVILTDWRLKFLDGETQQASVDAKFLTEVMNDLIGWGGFTIGIIYIECYKSFSCFFGGMNGSNLKS